MKIAILSDSHDHIWNLEKVVNEIKGNVDAYIHCGDLIAPFVPAILNRIGTKGYVCLGNNDEDHIAMKEIGGDSTSWVTVGQLYGELEIGDRKLAYTHTPKFGELLAQSGDYDAVFHGHNHTARNEIVGETLLVNPGAICGITAKVVIEGKGSHAPASYAIYDTETNTAEIIEIK